MPDITPTGLVDNSRKEELLRLSSDRVSLIVSSRGAIMRELSIDGQRITRDIALGETAVGEKGALFCCPVLFARFPGRQLSFNGKTFKLEYPAGLDAEKLDPNHNFIHGYEHYYTWDIAARDEKMVRFELNRQRLPTTFPFPHSSFVEYRLEGDSDLLITVGIKDCPAPTPAMLTIHPFFKFYLTDNSAPPKLTAHLESKFDYPPDSTEPMATEAPITMTDGGPFSKGAPLPKNLDHSFVSSGSALISWPSGVQLGMTDETSIKVSPIKPLQVWTTGADARNAFGIEQGGPANLFYLVANGRVPANWLPVCEAGGEISRVVRYTALDR